MYNKPTTALKYHGNCFVHVKDKIFHLQQLLIIFPQGCSIATFQMLHIYKHTDLGIQALEGLHFGM